MQLNAVKVKGFVTASLIDWPGRIATVLFLPGCNLRCRYCHARELVMGAASHIESIPIEGVFDFLDGMSEWVDGVVISGGEPTLCPNLADLAAEIKSRGFAVKLDTNGTRPDVLENLISEGLVDAVSMDIKAPLDKRYFDVTHTVFDLSVIRDSIRIIMDSRLDYEFRTTVSPALLSPSDVAEIAASIQGARCYTLQPFNPHSCLDAQMETMPKCPLSLLQDAARLAEGFVDKVVIRA